jgi:hypothetical protein
VGSIDDKFRDIRKRNVTIRSEIRTTNIRSSRFWDIGECGIMGVDITEFSVVPMGRWQGEVWHLRGVTGPLEGGVSTLIN